MGRDLYGALRSRGGLELFVGGQSHQEFLAWAAQAGAPPDLTKERL